MRRRLGTVAVLTAILVLAACGNGGATTPDSDPGTMIDEGSWYTREQWPHDGQPYESDTFIVFSDGAAGWARAEVAEEAERLWADILDEFEVTPDQLSFPDGQDKIHLYIYRDRYPEEWGMRAYWAGVILWSPDHPIRPTARCDWSPVLKHELVHVLENLLKGRDGGDDEMTDVWFSEGLAEAVVGGTAGGAIRDRHQLDDLVAQYGEVSPISFTRDSQVTPGAGYPFNYPMYQLAVEYLLDDDGMGRSLTDARDLYLEMAEGTNFGEAFAATMRMTTAEYEASFFYRMETYLPSYRNPLFSPIGFTVLAAVVIAAVAIALARAFKWSAATSRRPVSWYRAGGLLMVGSATVATGAYLGLLYIVGTDYELNNEMNGSSRLAGYAVVAGSLIVATALIVGSILIRRRRPVATLLGPGLALASVIGSIFALDAVF